jgi:hypothetical protein
VRAQAANLAQDNGAAEDTRQRAAGEVDAELVRLRTRVRAKLHAPELGARSAGSRLVVSQLSKQHIYRHSK